MYLNRIVIENWKELSNKNKTKNTGPCINMYEEELKKIKNAAGNSSINFDRKKVVFNDSNEYHRSVLCVCWFLR